MTPPEITWEKILPEPFVALELGARGEGKTLLGHRITEIFADQGDGGRDAYIMGFPSEKEHLLPEWIEPLEISVALDDWPENSIVLLNEAHHLLHARESMGAEHLDMDKLTTVSRQKDSCIVYDTQQSQRLDKNSVAAVDAILVRWPALMQERFERRAVRPIIEDAREALREYVEIHDTDDYTYVERPEDEDGVEVLKKHVYVHADRFRGEYPHEIQPPEHWQEAISNAFSGVSLGSNDLGGVEAPEEPNTGVAGMEDLTVTRE